MRRLGLDIGTNSIGWCLTEDDARIVDIGVRIFSDGRDPQSGTSLAVDRREARSTRRRRDRFIGRRDAFLGALVQYGLMPADADEAKLLADLDPYVLRARALDERLEPHEIGRALFHLNQRRGFKSNRKAERKTKDAEDGKIATGARELDMAMAAEGAETLGQFLFKRLTAVDADGRPDPKAARVRMDSDAQAYDFYPQRRHYVYEFQKIWDEQAKYHPTLLNGSSLTWEQLEEKVQHDENFSPTEPRDALYRILFFQRPLKEQPVGLCLFAGRYGIPANEPRLPKAHPLFQERRLYEEVNHLRITSPGAKDEPLTKEQRDKLILKLRGVRSAKYDALANLLKLGPGQSFNKRTETRQDMLGDEVFAAMSDKKRFGTRWATFDRGRQWKIIEQVAEEQDPDKLHAFLTDDCGLDEDRARATAQARLPELYGRIGATASARILEELKKDVITYDDAVKRCGWHHSDERTGEEIRRLPYYGELLSREIPPGSQDKNDPPEKRWGRITNPTVHIGLGQVQKLLNALIEVHGRPDGIVVELARDLKLNERDKEEHNKRIRRDTAAAKGRTAKLLGQDLEGNQVGEPIAADTGANRALLKMWEELNPSNAFDRRCPYCAKQIGIQQLFSDATQVDHIIPYSKSLDDSAANKIIAHRACNQQKGNSTPYERWGPHLDPERWDIITAQVARMHKSKQWRFGPDAMARIEKDGGFLERQLKDTQYLSKLAGTYLSSLYTPDEGRRVYVIPGRMTAMLRRLWALNDVLEDRKYVENRHSNAPKNRLDHRHHAIDGFVCSVTSQGLLMRIARAAGRAEEKNIDRQFEALPEPWPGYLPELKERLQAVTVSHKADHGRRKRPSPGHDMTSGKLHDETAYGLTGNYGLDGKTPVVVKRIAFSNLDAKDIGTPGRIRDDALRLALVEATDGLTGKPFEQAMARFAREHPVFKGIRRVRVLGERAGTPTLDVIPIVDKSGKPYKAYKGNANARFQVWRMPDGAWKHTTLSVFRAHQPDAADIRPHPAAKQVLDLRQNDLLAIERGGAREIVRVVKFSASGQVTLAAHNESGNLKARDVLSNDIDPFKYVAPTAGGLKKLQARQVRIDPLGRLFDPGPR
jgi:CRISPR-associated endonuclease Csn1